VTHCLDVGRGLDSGTEHDKPVAVLAGEVARGERRHCSGAKVGQGAAVDEQLGRQAALGKQATG
jgi:hypothetical protein